MTYAYKTDNENCVYSRGVYMLMKKKMKKGCLAATQAVQIGGYYIVAQTMYVVFCISSRYR
jgi:hypothetical protein